MNFRKNALVTSITMALLIGSAASIAATPNAPGGAASSQTDGQSNAPVALQPASQQTTTAESAASSASTPATKRRPKSKRGHTPPIQTLKAIAVVGQVGTNIKGVAPVGAEVLTLDRAAIVNTGAASIDQVLQNIPQISNNAPAGLGNERQGGTAAYGSAFGGANSTQGVSANLRGLGPQATLILLDGHRLTPTGAGAQFTSINQVPAAALEAVQVLTGGGSAVYGSDAVAGVINLVVRKDFNGVEVSPRATWANGYHTQDVSAVVGHTWATLGALGHGNFMMTFAYDHQSPMSQGASPYLSDDLRSFGGVNNEIRGGSVTTGAINGGIGPGQPGQVGSLSGGSGPVASPGATSNIAWCDGYVGGQCTTGTYLYRGLPLNSIASAYGETTAQPSLSDRAPLTYYLPLQRTYQFDTFYNQEVNDKLSFSFTGLYTYRTSFNAGSAYTSSIPVVTINPGSPFYIAPPSPAGGPMTVDLSPAATGLPPFNTSNSDRNWEGILSVHAGLWGDWQADLSSSYGHDRACGECQSDMLDVGALQYYVDTGAINPLSTSRLTPEQLSSVVGQNLQVNTMTIQDNVLKFNGTAFQLPAGPLKAAFGVESLRGTENVVNGASRTDASEYGIFESSALPPVGYEGFGCVAPLSCPPRTSPDKFAYDNIQGASQVARSAFAELYIPVVSEEQGVPLMRSLIFDVADRYDHYSDIGGRPDPKISFTWGMSRDVNIQGTWGRSFVAPNLVQSDPFVFSYKAFAGSIPNLTGNPAIQGTIPGLVNVGLIGGNQEKLQPETATTWSLGASVTPHDVPGLRLSATYYHISYKDLILGVSSFPAGLFSVAGYAIYEPFIHPVHNPSSCSATNPDYDPALLPYIQAVGIYGIVTPAQLCQMNVWVDGRNTNVGSMTENGADFSGRYQFRAGNSTWAFSLDVTKIMSESLALTSSQPSIGILGSMLNGGLVPWKGRASATWMKGPVSATIFGNYVGRYTNDDPLFARANSEVPSWTTFDLDLRFSFDVSASVPDWLAGSSVALHVDNMFDRDPPLVLTAAGAAFDGNNANVFGRIVSLQFQYSFF